MARPAAPTDIIPALTDTAVTEAIRPDAAHPAPEETERTRVRERLPQKVVRRGLFARVIEGITSAPRMPPGMGFDGG